jgi:hypothetical protein
MSLYSKLPRKHTSPSIFVGTVGSTTLRAEGRTKREAEKRLRTAFARVGLSTIVRLEGKDRLEIRGPLSKAEMYALERGLTMGLQRYRADKQGAKQANGGTPGITVCQSEGVL